MDNQTQNFCQNMNEYYEELDIALNMIRERDGNDFVVINGHSTGGLLTAVYCSERKNSGNFQAVVHNSPFYDINENWLSETLGIPVLVSYGRLFPFGDAPKPNDVYGKSVHRDQHGEWDFDVSIKPIENFPVKAGWVRAIVKAQEKIHKGNVDLGVPAIVLYSNDCIRLGSYSREAQYMDTVLDVDDINRYAGKTGSDVTKVVINRGMHDLCLSEEQARNQYFEEVSSWLNMKF